jgi:hypothetical protein
MKQIKPNDNYIVIPSRIIKHISKKRFKFNRDRGLKRYIFKKYGLNGVIENNYYGFGLPYVPAYSSIKKVIRVKLPKGCYNGNYFTPIKYRAIIFE